MRRHTVSYTVSDKPSRMNADKIEMPYQKLHPCTSCIAAAREVSPPALRGKQSEGGRTEMEQSTDCPRPSPVRGPHGGWKQQEIAALRESIAAAEERGESLRSVFERMSGQLGRRPNSIRNFYYAQLRAGQDGEDARTAPFETFAPDEVEELVEQVITARAQGMSVRACVRKLADGDRTRMLRYQNKYRSTVRTRPELVRRVMNRLSEAGTPYVSPYAAQENPPELSRLKTRAQNSGDKQIEQLFSSLDYLLGRVLTQPAEHAPDDSVQRRADRLGAQCDVLRIELDDEQKRFARLQGETEGMVLMLKEYIALPD